MGGRRDQLKHSWNNSAACVTNAVPPPRNPVQPQAGQGREASFVTWLNPGCILLGETCFLPVGLVKVMNSVVHIYSDM